MLSVKDNLSVIYLDEAQPGGVGLAGLASGEKPGNCRNLENQGTGTPTVASGWVRFPREKSWYERVQDWHHLGPEEKKNSLN